MKMIELAMVENDKYVIIIVMTQKFHTVSGGVCTRMYYDFAHPPNLKGRQGAKVPTTWHDGKMPGPSFT